MGAKVLFVDDTKLQRKAGSNALAAGGFEAVTAADGNEALAALEKEAGAVGLVLTDWNMPGMNGFDLLVKIKGDERWRQLPVVMITSEAEKENINQAMTAGAADYLVKPYDNDELIGKVRKLLGT